MASKKKIARKARNAGITPFELEKAYRQSRWERRQSHKKANRRIAKPSDLSKVEDGWDFSDPADVDVYTHDVYGASQSTYTG